MKKITISEFIANERIVRKKVIANHSNGEKRAIEDFSYVSFFLGKEYDEEISKIIKNNSDDLFVIDFLDSSIGITDIENIIKSAYNSKNERWKFVHPIIFFKNVEKIIKYSSLEQFLLPIFDHQQNNNVLGGINLSEFILIANSSSEDAINLSFPLISRLDFFSFHESKKNKESSIDRNFLLILFSSFLLLFFLMFKYKEYDRKAKE